MRTHGLRFDVNCSILFTELPMVKRPEAARAAGFDAVEFWWPFADPVPGPARVLTVMMTIVLDLARYGPD